MRTTAAYSLKIFALPLLIALAVQACGQDEDPCEKARDIQKRICRESNSQKCFPCPCVLRDQDYMFATDAFGIPDVAHSDCMESPPCEGFSLSSAEECLEDEHTCDPRYYNDIKLFENGEPQPGFESICNGDW